MINVPVRVQLVSAFSDLRLVVTAISVDYVDDITCTDIREMGIADMLDTLADCRYWRKDSDLMGIASELDLRNALADAFDCGGCQRVIFETPSEHAHNKSERERKALERDAASLARRFGVSVNSPEFIDACQGELGRLQDYREGMREDGLCIGFGVTSEQWCDEFNGSQSDTGNVRRIMRWVEDNLPLLYAKWQYSREN